MLNIINNECSGIKFDAPNTSLSVSDVFENVCAATDVCSNEKPHQEANVDKHFNMTEAGSIDTDTFNLPELQVLGRQSTDRTAVDF